MLAKPSIRHWIQLVSLSIIVSTALSIYDDPEEDILAEYDDNMKIQFSDNNQPGRNDDFFGGFDDDAPPDSQFGFEFDMDGENSGGGGFDGFFADGDGEDSGFEFEFDMSDSGFDLNDLLNGVMGGALNDAMNGGFGFGEFGDSVEFQLGGESGPELGGYGEEEGYSDGFDAGFGDEDDYYYGNENAECIDKAGEDCLEVARNDDNFWSLCTQSHVGYLCQQSCGFCLDDSLDSGVEQVVDGTEEETQRTEEIIRLSNVYLHKLANDRVLSTTTLNKCINEQKMCAFWAGIHECDNNPKFMKTTCSLACRSCD